jgi:hypothetical protein
MTITSELANGQVYVLSNAWLHGEATITLKRARWIWNSTAKKDFINDKELVLKKPITAHNEKLHVLELREPLRRN